MSSWKVAPGSGSGSVSTRARPPLLWVLSLPQELPFLGLFCPKSHGQSLLRRWFFDSFSSFVPRFLAVFGNSIPSARFPTTENGSHPSPARRRTLGPRTNNPIEGAGGVAAAATPPSSAQPRPRARVPAPRTRPAPRLRRLDPPARRPYPACPA